MARTVHFELPAKNMEVLKAFYSKVFGWKIEKWQAGPIEYWMITTGENDQPGINGGFYKQGGPLPATGTVNTIGVENLDEALAKLVANGGQVVVPKGEIPGVGWLAYGKDPEGTVFGMMQAMPGSMM
jgi:uncharacterized protein